jgi:hypothetical protein
VSTGRKEYRVAPMIVYAVVGGFGLVMLYVGLTELVAQRRLMACAVPVRAEILSSRVSESTSSNTDRRPLRSNSTTSYTSEVRFRYSINGATYESDLLRPTIIVQGHASRSGAEEEISAFRAGATVDAWVDPQTPERGFLIKGASAGPMVFALLGLLLPPLGWLASRLV